MSFEVINPDFSGSGQSSLVLHRLSIADVSQLYAVVRRQELLSQQMLRELEKIKLGTSIGIERDLDKL